MRNHLDRADTNNSITSSIGPLKLQQNSVYQDLDNIWQLGINDGDQGSENVAVVGGGSLGFHHRSGEQALTSQ